MEAELINVIKGKERMVFEENVPVDIDVDKEKGLMRIATKKGDFVEVIIKTKGISL